MRLSIFSALILAATACKTVTGPSALQDAGASSGGGKTRTLIGNLPARYLDGANGQAFGLAAITIQGGVIRAVKSVTPEEAEQMAPTDGVVLLRPSEGAPYDVVYPGMMNLHNHTKQNIVPVWGEAKGQFANRFEWRGWDVYTKSVSFNMNPWIGTPVSTCAAFRWSELQAMVLGTTYLQGPSSCISNFGINQVEDKNAYLADSAGKKKDKVQAPTDLVVPGDMPFVWRDLAPMIRQGMTYEQALLAKVNEYCPKLVAQYNIKDVDGAAELKVFADKKAVIAGCDKDPDGGQDSLGAGSGSGADDDDDDDNAVAATDDPSGPGSLKFIRFLWWQHKNIAAKKQYLASANHAGIIVHLAEGRRNDPYNQVEFEMLKLFGLDQPNVNLVHAVGVDAAGYQHMAERKMGLIWSPFSNFLLYGETADVKAAKEAGVTIALGSDWTPTGSRGVLEELKVARAYVKKNKMDDLFTDEALFEMVTENPAKMINHFETTPGDGIHDIGTVKVDAAASLIAVRNRVENPYTNFVTAESKDIDLVMVDGKMIYGEPAYLLKNDPTVAMEMLPAYYAGINDLANDQSFPVIPPNTAMKSVDWKAQEIKIAQAPALAAVTPINPCGFQKGFVRQNSGEETVLEFKAASGLDLDTASGIEKLLAANIVTQSFNHSPNDKKGDPKFAVKKYPSMFGCADAGYDQRLSAYFAADGMSADESSTNKAARAATRQTLKLGRVPASLAKMYSLTYDPAVDY